MGSGDSHTSTLHGDIPGTYVYHRHYRAHNRVDEDVRDTGFSTPIPRLRPTGPGVFFTLLDWNARLHDREAGGDSDYDPVERSSNADTINGRSVPTTFHPELGPVDRLRGREVHLTVANNGSESHPFHTRGRRLTVIEKAGRRFRSRPARGRRGHYLRRYTLEFEADAGPGSHLDHCHSVHHVTIEDR